MRFSIFVIVWWWSLPNEQDKAAGQCYLGSFLSIGGYLPSAFFGLLWVSWKKVLILQVHSCCDVIFSKAFWFRARLSYQQSRWKPWETRDDLAHHEQHRSGTRACPSAGQGVGFPARPIKAPWPGHGRGVAKCRETTSTVFSNWTNRASKHFRMPEQYVVLCRSL